MDTKEYAQQLIANGSRLGASDLYILPMENDYYLKFRFQGQMMSAGHLSNEHGMRLILFFKFLGDMDVGEKRRPQLGSCCFSYQEQSIRLRLSTVSNYRQQESLVIRFLYQHQMRQLQFFASEQWEVLKQVTSQTGLHLFSGPVGSGKTTSMYALARLQEEQQIITIEDPVEIEESSFLQLQVQPKIGVDYDELIKLCLRHRPDLMIIGEIRDEQTARYALRAALTGHRVFATLHAKSIQGVRNRLFDLGMSKIELEQSLSSITYQRLLATVCPICGFHCQPFCSHYLQFYRVLMAIESQGQIVESWNERLLSAWKVGAISEEVYLQAQQINAQ